MHGVLAPGQATVGSFLSPDNPSSPMNPHYLRGNSLRERIAPNPNPATAKGLSQEAKIKTQIHVPSGFLPLNFFPQSLWSYDLKNQASGTTQ